MPQMTTGIPLRTRPLAALNDELIIAIVPISADQLFFFESENIYYSTDAGRSVLFFPGA